MANIDRVEYLPLGSVVVVRGAVKKMMVIGRGLAAALDGGTKVFDYCGCLYPEGLVGDQVLYFNHADIAKIVFEGLSDDDNALMVDNINAWLETTPYERGSALEINNQAQTDSDRKDG